MVMVERLNEENVKLAKENVNLKEEIDNSKKLF